MWKLIVGFLVFAAIALFVLKKAGGDIDISGEKHGVETGGHAASAPAAAPASAAAPAPAPASAASQ